MIGWLIACSGWAADGELWLKLEETEADGDRVQLTLPVSDLREEGALVTLETPSGTIDLRAEARRLRVGDERTWTSTDGGAVHLVSTPTAPAAPATLVAMGITGPKGGGFEVTFPLEPATLGEVDAKVEGAVDLDVDGLSLALDDDACAQLRRSPPITLVEIVGPEGNGLRIRSR